MAIPTFVVAPPTLTGYWVMPEDIGEVRSTPRPFEVFAHRRNAILVSSSRQSGSGSPSGGRALRDAANPMHRFSAVRSETPA